ncbi:MAG: sensor histidine kinase [Chitinophagaceae bacterium]|nr:sensor histidine kinase [Chitinophagaceae bacterium]
MRAINFKKYSSSGFHANATMPGDENPAGTKKVVIWKKHIIFWICYLGFLWIFAITKSSEADFTTFIITNCLLISVFYYNYLLIQPLFFNKKVLVSILLFFTGMFVYFGLRYWITYFILPYFGKPIYDFKTPNEFFPNHTYFYLTYSIYALLFWYAQKSIKSERELRLSEIQKLQLQNRNLQLQNENLNLQNEKIKLEYNFLKAQINPHFLYNTLNFFYSKTLMHSEEAADGIAKLTDIMRYALQTGGADGKVFLEQEVEHIHNYIALQRMRFNNTICIDFTATGNIHSYRILPHILITLLENAFKHGDTLDTQHPVTVRLQAVENCIYFSIYNKIRIGPKDGPSTGVGLSNISDRLQMEYGNKQSLQYNSDGSFFSVQLSIQSNGTGVSTTKAATPIDATN